VFAVNHDGREEQLVGAEALLARLAIHKGIGESVHVTGGLPDLRMHDDRGLEADDIVAPLHHTGPPASADVVLQRGTEGAVIEEAVETAVDFGGGKDEAPALGKRDEVFHSGFGGSGFVGHSPPSVEVILRGVNSGVWEKRGTSRGLSSLRAKHRPGVSGARITAGGNRALSIVNP